MVGATVGRRGRGGSCLTRLLLDRGAKGEQMTRTLVSIRSGVFSEDAQEISTEFFGGNMLFDRDRVGETGTYDEKAAALNLGLIRYPGGNVSEIFFDIANPDKTIEENGHSGTLMPSLNSLLTSMISTPPRPLSRRPCPSWMDWPRAR